MIILSPQNYISFCPKGQKKVKLFSAHGEEARKIYIGNWSRTCGAMKISYIFFSRFEIKIETCGLVLCHAAITIGFEMREECNSVLLYIKSDLYSWEWSTHTHTNGNGMTHTQNSELRVKSCQYLFLSGSVLKLWDIWGCWWWQRHFFSLSLW